MKQRITLLIILAFHFLSNGQSAERQVLGNAGGTSILPDNIYVTWTLGESFVSTRTFSSFPLLGVVVTEGFQQPTSDVVPTITLPAVEGTISILPNPAHDELLINLSELPKSPLKAYLFDSTGRVVIEFALSDLGNIVFISDLSSATYLLSITDGANWSKGVKIVKY